MDRPDRDIPDDAPDIDLRTLKRALMRREEAVERFREAKARMLRARRSEEMRREDQAPHQG